MMVVTLVSWLLLTTAASPTANLSSSAPVPKQLRWWMSFPNRSAPFLLNQDNPLQWGNTSLGVADISHGFIQCCQPLFFDVNGSLPVRGGPSGHTRAGGWAHDEHDLQQFRAGGREVFVTATVAGDQYEAFCWAALARLDAFTAELLAFLTDGGIDGINLDWETGKNNSIPCYLQLWGNVSKSLHAQGKKFSSAMDDSKGLLFDNSARNWSYEVDFKPFIPFTDYLINMGTYPGGWAKETAWPAWKYLKPFRCAPSGPRHKRWCGLEGQILDMLDLGLDPASGQLQPSV